MIYVIGHKNPDTDSICSAIGYAAFKSAKTGEAYAPASAQHRRLELLGRTSDEREAVAWRDASRLLGMSEARLHESAL